jgi:hypothetical protein
MELSRCRPLAVAVDRLDSGDVKGIDVGIPLRKVVLAGIQANDNFGAAYEHEITIIYVVVRTVRNEKPNRNERMLVQMCT